MANLRSPQKVFEQAVAIAGGQSRFARAIGCTPGNVSQLLKKGSPLPGHFVLKAEAATGVSRHELRPDIYPIEDAPVGADTAMEPAR